MSICIPRLHLLCALAFGILIAPLLAAQEWHVDDGANGGDGSPGNPFGTIQAAATLAVAGDSIIVQAGVYRERVRFANDGNDGAPIVLRGAAGETAVVSGMDVVAGDWQTHSGAIHVIDLDNVPGLAASFSTELNQAEQLLCDGRMLLEARTPNVPHGSLDPLDGGWFTVDSLVDTLPGTEDPNDDIPDWASRYTLRDAALADVDVDLVGAQIFLKPWQYRGHGWGFLQNGRVIAHDGDTIVCDLPKSDKLEAGAIYRLSSLRGLLDAPGEWYHDPATHELYVWLPDGGDPADHLIEIKRRDYAIDLDRRAHITVQDLRVVGATLTTDLDAGNDGAGSGQTAVGRSSVHGWPIAEAHHITVERVHFRYINHFHDCSGGDNWQWSQASGVIISGSDHCIRDCVIEYAAGNGIMAIGHDIAVTNNHVHSVDYMLQLAAGISTGFEFYNYGMDIGYNTVRRCGFDGITTQKTRTTAARPSRIHHNRISGFGLWTEDVGGIKSVGHDEEINGTRYDHNIISDGGDWSYGLYQDYSTGFVMDHNLVWDVRQGINLNDGVDHRVYNNTVWGSGGDHDIGGKVDDCDVRNNLTAQASVSFNGTGTGMFRTNLIAADADLVRDPSQGDLRLHATAVAAIDQGEAIPPYTDDVSDGAPDIGALESGHDVWRAGCSLPAPTPAAPGNLIAVRQADGGVALRWSDRSADETRFILERALYDIHGRHWQVVATVAANVTEAFDMAAPTATVCYRVRADASPYSNTAVLRIYAGGRWACEGDLHDTAIHDAVDDLGAFLSGATVATPVFGNDAAVGDHSVVLEPASQQYVSVPDAPEVRIADRFTWIGWVKPTAWMAQSVIFAKRSTMGNDGVGVALSYHYNNLRLVTSGGSQTIDGYMPPEDAWTMLAVTYDATTRQMRLYATDANGELVTIFADDNWNAEDLSSDAPLCFGGHPASLDRTFAGEMDDQRLYHRALSVAAIEAIRDGTDSPATPVVTIDTTATAIPEAGGGAWLTFRRDGATDADLVVRYTSSAGLARAGEDFVALPNAVVIPAGQHRVQVRLSAIDDALSEGDETVTVVLADDGDAYDLGAPSSTTVTIADDDGGGVRRVSLRIDGDTVPSLSAVVEPGGDEGQVVDGAYLFTGLPTGVTHTFSFMLDGVASL